MDLSAEPVNNNAYRAQAYSYMVGAIPCLGAIKLLEAPGALSKIQIQFTAKRRCMLILGNPSWYQSNWSSGRQGKASR